MIRAMWVALSFRCDHPLIFGNSSHHDYHFCAELLSAPWAWFGTFQVLYHTTVNAGQFSLHDTGDECGTGWADFFFLSSAWPSLRRDRDMIG